MMMREDPGVTLARATEKAQEQGIEVNPQNLSRLINEELRTTIDISRFGAAVTALVAGQDVGVAIAVGTSAVENNFEPSELHACLEAYADSLAEQAEGSERFVGEASRAARSAAPTARDKHVSAGLRLAAAQRRRALSLSSRERLTEFYGDQYDHLFLERGEQRSQLATMGLAVGMATGGGVLATAAVAGGCATVEAGLDVMAGASSSRDALGHIVGETAGALFFFKTAQAVGRGVKAVGGALSKARGVPSAPRGLGGAQVRAERNWVRGPSSIQDQMVLEAAKRGEGRRIMGELGDVRFKDMEKFQLKVKSQAGRDTVVHYVRNPKTGELLDFKFKKRSID
jgi:hypothetical protein